MQRLEVSGSVRPIYGLLGIKRLSQVSPARTIPSYNYQYSFSYYPPIYTYVFQVDSSLQVSTQKKVYIFIYYPYILRLLPISSSLTR